MRLKYIVETKNKNNILVLREFEAADQERFHLLNEETYDIKQIKSAISKGKKALIFALRTGNMYPPGPYVEKIAEAVTQVIGSKKGRSMELVVDDLEFIDKKLKKMKIPEPVDTEDTDFVFGDDAEACSDETCALNFDDNNSDLFEALFPFDEVA